MAGWENVTGLGIATVFGGRVDIKRRLPEIETTVLTLGQRQARGTEKGQPSTMVSNAMRT